MLTRVTIANITAQEAAEAGQAAGLSGSVTQELGFGSWGIEPGVTIELAHGQAELVIIRWWVTELLTKRGESAAYVTVDGEPRLWEADGRVNAVDGHPLSLPLPELEQGGVKVKTVKTGGGV